MEPFQQQQQQQLGREKASAQWQQWKPDTRSSIQNDTTAAPEASWNMSSSSSSYRDGSLHKDGDDTSSIWNDDWDDNNDFPTPHLNNQGSSTFMTATHDYHERTGWSPEPPEDTPTPFAATTTTTTTTGLMFDSVTQSSPAPSESLSYQEHEIIKHEFSLVHGRKESRNISIDDILVRTIRRKGSPATQHHRSPSISSPPPNNNNASPFMYPSFFGTPSTDHYNQYVDGRKSQQRTKDTYTYRSQKRK